MKYFIREILTKAVEEMLEGEGIECRSVPNVLIESPRVRDHGDYATNIAMTLASQYRKPPRPLADAIVDHIEEEMAEVERPYAKEGYDTREWVLLDYINVVVHVFHDASREYYDLERLWADAIVTELSEEDEITSTAPFNDL